MNEEFVKRVQEIGLQLYKGTSQEDLSVFQWYREMSASNDLYEVFPRSCWPLSKFYDLFRPPKMLLYIEDSTGIWFAVWLESLEAAFVFSMWVAKRMRGTRQQVEATRLAYRAAFNLSPTLVGMTKRPELLAEHEKLGYEVLGKISKLFDGQEDAWIVVLTKDAFEKGALGNDRL